MSKADEMVKEAYGYHLEGKLEPAQMLYSKALDLEPSHLGALSGLGTVLLHNRQAEAARKVWGRICTLHPERVEALANLSLAYQLEGRLDQAEQCLQRALAIKPEAYDLFCQMAALRLEQGREEAAWHLYDRALELGQDDFATLMAVGTAHVKARHWPQAEVCYRRLAELRPQDWSVLSDLGYILRRAGRPGEAAEVLTRALVLDPGNPHASNNLAAAFMTMGKWARAAELLGQVVTLMPEWPGARLNLGYAHLAQGKLSDATLEFLAVLEQNPDDLAALCHLGRALYLQGRLEAAGEAFERALALEPGTPEALVGKSGLLLLRGEIQEGWSLLRRVYQGSPHPLAPELPMWGGAEHQEGRVLVWADSGLAEVIIALPALQALAAKGLEPWLDAHPAWHGLLAGAKGCAGLAGPGDTVERYSCHMPLGALPAVLNIGPPAEGGSCLALPPEEKIAAWRERLAALGDGPKLGLAWACRDGSPWDAAHSPGPECWSGLAGLKDAALVPLISGPPPKGLDLAKLEPPEDLAELAALMAALDGLVLTEGWMAAWAGAAGLDAWVLLGPGPGWSWGLDAPFSPWHPGLELIRTGEAGDWAAAGEKLAARLSAWLQEE